MTDAGWKLRPEGGGRFAPRLLASIALRFGRSLTRCLLFPITLYFLIVRGPERRASRAFLTRVTGRPAGIVDIARHMHAFASTILDRVFLLSRSFDGFEVQVSGLDALHADMDRGRGVLLIGSHHGSFEVLRVLSRQRPDTRIAVVLDRAQSPVITALLEALNPDLARDVIDAGQDPTAIVLAIRDALEQGALVGLLGDRAREGHATQDCVFLGENAPFPVAPWLIASVLRVPVQLSFGLYRGGARYDLRFEHFLDGADLPRRTRGDALADIVQGYAARLEHHVREAPFNWFNFYDFWRSNGSSGEDVADKKAPAVGHERDGDSNRVADDHAADGIGIRLERTGDTRDRQP